MPAEVIEKAKKYIYGCKNPDGGISYSSTNRGSSRPAITAAALAALYNAGDYDSEHVPAMLEYCKKNLYRLGDTVRSFGHWHYTYLYYAQVVYRQGDDEWAPFRDKLYDRICQRAEERRQLGRQHRSDLRHGLQSDHSAARQGLLAHLSTVDQAAQPCLPSFCHDQEPVLGRDKCTALGHKLHSDL